MNELTANPIVREEDLKYYEDYLNNLSITNQKPKTMIPKKPIENLNLSQNYLQTVIGKLLKVEILNSNFNDCKIGILLDVGLDYIIIKQYQNCCTVMIPINNIKFITIVHDNDIRKTTVN
ncbi:MAG: hypothetical protein IKT38_06385 [Clostridia bacterium]|nr:hypothetical protein [Clostridia bacterium]